MRFTYCPPFRIAGVISACISALLYGCGGGSGTGTAGGDAGSAPLNASQVAERCAVGTLEKEIEGLTEAKITSASVNSTGSFKPPTGNTVNVLPAYCDIQLSIKSGEAVANIRVWAPLEWNERFMGTLGGGNLCPPMWEWPVPYRQMTMPIAIRKGFVVASTDCGNRDTRTAWNRDPQTGTLNTDLIRSWAYEGTHDMAVVGKIIARALYRRNEKYSYALGTSGGGRQAMMEAQRYPTDFNGIWASDPAIYWDKVFGAMMWPPLVMKELKNPLSADKLNAFQKAAISACDGLDGLVDGLISNTTACTWDPNLLVGSQTPEGATVTATDALVMQKIWEGPRTSTGEFMWYGLRRGTSGAGIASTAVVNGQLVPVPFSIALDWWANWLKGDPNWDWQTLTVPEYESLFAAGKQMYPDVATDSTDLSALRAAGTKLIISAAANDALIYPDQVIRYYNDVTTATGGLEATKSFARLFSAAGDEHSLNLNGPGMSLDNGLDALMNWVEKSQAPDQILGEQYDNISATVPRTRPICAYPMVPRYLGNGADPNAAASFKCDTHY